MVYGPSTTKVLNGKDTIPTEEVDTLCSNWGFATPSFVHSTTMEIF